MTNLIRRPGGRGAPQSKPTRIPFTRFDRGWTNCVCMASGPSLTQEQVDQVAAARPQWRVLVVNNTWERLPDADILYAGDESWWSIHLPSVQARFTGECWTASRRIAHRDAIHFVKVRGDPGLSHEPGLLHSGGNSGYQTVNLAYQLGARRILLVGYDMQRTYGMSHWHGDHVGVLNRAQGFSRWCSAFDALAADLAAAGVSVVNCSLESALTCFPFDTLSVQLSAP